MTPTDHSPPAPGVAIVGMAGRWPGARTPAEFWRNVRDGVESISRLRPEELEVAGAADLARQSDYIRARSVLADPDLFDAAFFGILPRDAELIDPQHRVFLECCWEALEDGGYDPQTYPGAIGVAAGCGLNTYLLRNVCADRAAVEEFTASYPLAGFPTLLGAMADTLATRVSYKLNLRGPSYTVQTACSTSLVAVAQACQALLAYQCDMVLAGGVAITFPQKRGYHYQEGGMGSSDGRCRPFEANATGTVFGSGAGVVLLKRLEDALADGDHVYAVIRGSAVNNDGSTKVGFTAPSVDGQAAVVALAQELAGIDPATIGYLESHGTATPLGDPIEFTALTRAFRAKTAAKNFCALGGVKRNVGHLEMAAGVTGLIAAAQALTHGQLPPAAGFEKPNPNIDLADSPFYVNSHLAPWGRNGTPRRAGVSSFGVGGTNAHVILEEAPEVPPPAPRPGHLLVLSARSAAALDAATNNLARHLRENPGIDPNSVAFTLQAGRRAFPHRRVLTCTSVDDAAAALEKRDRTRVATRTHTGDAATVVFMFPGQGSQAVNMGAGLYQAIPEFRADVDACADILAPHLGLDLRTALYPDSGTVGPNLTDTRLAQPVLFVIEYALARQWMRWGIRPAAMIGHSIGEFVAACMAGVFSLDDALAVIAARGRMMQDLPPGRMLSVRLAADEVLPLLNGELSLSAVNGPALCVVSGPDAAVANLEDRLRERGVAARTLVTSHAFHSRMMDPILVPFTDYLRRFRLNAPRMPFVSGVSGTWITDAEATDPTYWARHVREPVRFSDGIRLLNERSGNVFLEVGPGRVLCTLTGQHRDGPSPPVTAASLPGPTDGREDYATLLHAAGSLWLHGVTLDWPRMHGPGVRRCPLPTYPFERQRYWVEPPAPTRPDLATPPATDKVSNELFESVPIEKEPPMSELAQLAVGPVSRKDRLLAALTDLFAESSGLTLGDGDRSVTFLELGFDSLFLTQITQAVQARFGVRVTFRQLLDQVSSLSALAEYLDAKLPADAIAPVQTVPPAPHVVPPPAVAPAGPPVPAAIDAIIREQLQAFSQLMTKQLEIVRGVVPNGQPAAHVSPPPVAAPAPPAAEVKPCGPYKPPQQGAVGGLTDRQARYLDDFIRRYTARTARSKQSTQANRPVLADPRAVAGFRGPWKEMVYPVVSVRSRGCRFWDVDGNEYIDLVNGFGPIFFGHAPDFITDAVAAQMKSGFETGPQTPLAGQVAELVRDLTGNERVTFCNTGSEAVMAALRVARTVTGRNKVVVFAGSYHGTFDEVLVKAGRKSGAPQAQPVAPGIPVEKAANVVVLDYGTPESLDYIRRHAHELAAVLVEPVQSRHPALQPVEFVREVRAITEASETALILDEVVTGFRAHPGGVQALFGVRADLVSYGKVAGGGLPIGILAGRAKFMDALDGGAWRYGDDSFPEVGVTFFAGTFIRHPLALAAAHAVLTRLKEAGPELQRSLNEKTTKLARELNAVFEEHNVPTRVEHFASWFYFSFAPDQQNGSLLYYHLRSKGVHVLENYPCFLTTAHTEADLAAVVRAFKESVLELQGGGFLTGPASREAGTPAASVARLEPVRDVTLPREVPLTESQREVWLAARFGDEASCAFNESFVLHLSGPLNRPALETALRQLIGRHDALRGTFDPDGTCFRVRDTLLLDVTLTDLSSRVEAEQDGEFREIVRSAASTPFDLVAGPLVRVNLVKLGPDRHALLVTSHHIVCDGWSTNVLLTELGQLYASQCDGRDRSLPAPMPFRAYALAEAKEKHSPDRAAVESWWAEKFAAAPAPLELPTDRPRGSVKSFRGDTVRRVVTGAPYHRVKKFGAQQGCTLFVTLLTGFKALLCRLTGQTDVVVGIPAAGQSVFEGDTLVGHCVNFLPLRSSFEGDPTAAGALAQVRGTLLDAYDHQNYTYGSLVQKLGLKRDPSRLPLVEVQFNLERVGPGLEFPGLQARVDPCPKSFVNFDLFLNAVETDDGLVLDCDYNRDLFDPATVERWLGHLEILLEGMAADPRRAVSGLPLLTDAERHRLVVEWNDTRVDFPRDSCVHDLIAEQVGRTAGNVAVICGDRRLTYAELDGEANRLAHYLQTRGVGTGDRVAVCLDRSPEMLVAVLGVLKAGAAYVPLDPDFPRDRIAAVLADAAPKLVLTQADVADRLGLTTTNVACLDTIRLDLAKESDHPPPRAAVADGPAYVIYTSGSTGKPKGVQVPHRAVVNFLTSMARQPGLTADDTLLAVTTLSFDIAVLELYLPLCVGGRVVIATREVTADGYKLLALLTESRATVMQATPATWRLLLEAKWAGGTSLKVLCGGEALPRDLADALLARAGSVWNMYGPTETTVWSATSPVEPGPGPVTIGPPIANTEFYILDAKGQPVPLGVAGELHIGGDGVALGYWNRPELTAEKFIPDPFRGNDARMYRTGDLVRPRSDGTLEFLGRLDNQVKIRGFRIETGDVEHALKQYPSLRDCVVVAREDSPGDKQLVAYVVAAGPPPGAGDLRRHLAGLLPGYMVPSAFVPLDALPQTPNGKVDRRALPAPAERSSRASRNGAAPRNPREQTLAAICAEVLKLECVDVGDNLFDLGADSLQVFQIVARAQAAGMTLSPRQVLAGRTVAAICGEIEAIPRDTPPSDSLKLAPVSRDRYRQQRSHIGAGEQAK